MSGFIKRHKGLWITLISVVGGVAALWIAKAALLSMALSFSTGLPISVADWRMGWRSMELRGISVRTPDPVYPKGLSIGSVQIKAGLFDFLKHTSRIDSVSINSVFMGVNIRSNGSSNWGKALSKVTSSKGSGSSSGSSARFVIGNFAMNNVTVAMKRPGKSEKRFGPTSFSVRNLGSQEPMTMGGLMKFIVREVTASIIKKYALPNLLQNIIKTPGNFLKKLFGREIAPPHFNPEFEPGQFDA
jgi:hypothetical protein